MTDPHDDILAQLRAANPVPDTTLDRDAQARADATLAAILGSEEGQATATASGAAPVASLDAARARRAQRRGGGQRSWFAAAAAAVLVVVGAVAIPQLTGNEPVATADEVLNAVADLSAARPEPGVTDQRYLQRTDVDGENTLVTEYEVRAGDEPSVQTKLTGTLTPALESVGLDISAADVRAADTPEALEALAARADDDATVGLVQLLIHPALSSEQTAEVYRALADDGLTVDDSAEGAGQAADTATLSTGDVTFTILTQTGQLVRATGLVAPGVDTTIDAAAILGCVSTTSLEGPKDLSLGCADQNYVLRDLAWTNWSADSATATGTAVINDCDSSCAEGTFHEFPVQVTVRDKKECGYNARLYSALDVAFEGTEAARDETFDIGCSPTEEGGL